MTKKETELLAALDIAIEYIQNIADSDSPTLLYLMGTYEKLSKGN